MLGAHALLTRGQGTGFRTVRPSRVAFVIVGQARALMLGSAAFATAVAVSLCKELDARQACVKQAISAG